MIMHNDELMLQKMGKNDVSESKKKFPSIFGTPAPPCLSPLGPDISKWGWKFKNSFDEVKQFLIRYKSRPQAPLYLKPCGLLGEVLYVLLSPLIVYKF